MLAVPPPALTTLTPVSAAMVSDRLAPAAAWYFADQCVALDSRLQPAAAIWLAGSQRLTVTDLQLSPLRARCDDQQVALALTPALASNPTFINSDTLRFFAGQALSLRGDWRDDVGQSGSARSFVVRTLWPQAWRLQHAAPAPTADALAWLPRADAAAQQGFVCHTLWQRDSMIAKNTVAENTAATNTATTTTRWGVGIMLNGAQGDDDEAHGGHFALVLGPLAADGSLADLLVANFYNPDVVSEKGILPALVPLDDYLHELNAGQQHYRPSWLMLAELAEPEVVATLYPVLNTVLQQLYDHRLQYNHVANNCTGLSMDALRRAGMQVPLRGPTSRWLAPLAALQQAWRERGSLPRSLKAARDGWRYLQAEQTRLLPWQAFDASVRHMLALLDGSVRPNHPLEGAFLHHAIAIYGVQLQQLPSARKRGREPATSLADYQRRVPANRADWQIIPVPARTLPAALRADLSKKI